MTRYQTSRQAEINRLRSELVLSGFPRLKMLLIVSITGGAGLLASFSLLHLGMKSMALRYPSALAIAYFVFLFLLWLWLRTTAEDYVDPDLSSLMDNIPDVSDGPVSSYNGISVDIRNDGGAVSDALSAVGDADEFIMPILVFVVFVSLFLSSLWIVYTAPTLFAELLVDGVLSASLYRKLRGLETQHWLATAISRTAWVFFLTAVILALCGKGMHYYAPDALTIGDVLHHSILVNR